MSQRPASDRARRRSAYLLGLRAESLAIGWLRLKGYAILDRRFSAHGGEIDIVAARGQTVAFVEVKARRQLELAQYAITPAKRERLARAARAWLARHPQTQGKIWRADAIYLARWRLPLHVAHAFELGFDE